MEKTQPVSSGEFHELDVEIKNSQGLHARPASKFVAITSGYPETRVTVVKDSMEVDGKSIIGMIMLAAGQGTKLTLRAQGKGAPEMLEKLQDLVESGFDE